MQKKWKVDSMVKTVKAVRAKEMDLVQASKVFSVSRATLKIYLNCRSKKAEASVTMRMGR
jgi:hypothetical protein